MVGPGTRRVTHAHLGSWEITFELALSLVGCGSNLAAPMWEGSLACLFEFDLWPRGLFFRERPTRLKWRAQRNPAASYTSQASSFNRVQSHHTTIDDAHTLYPKHHTRARWAHRSTARPWSRCPSPWPATRPSSKENSASQSIPSTSRQFCDPGSSRGPIMCARFALFLASYSPARLPALARKRSFTWLLIALACLRRRTAAALCS